MKKLHRQRRLIIRNISVTLFVLSGIAEITKHLIMEIAMDDRIIDHFEDSNVQRFREKLREHLCVIADGPCDYTGDNMIDTHTGMGITESDFNAVVEGMMVAMTTAGIAIPLQNQLLSRLAELRAQIIYR
jgi:hemoglobin